MKKRILVVASVSVVLLTAFAACKKENKNDIPSATPTAAPTSSVSEDSGKDNKNDEVESQAVTFGGDYLRDNGSLSFYLSDGGWKVNGYHTTKENSSSPVVLSGSASFKEGTVFLYSDGDNELSFTFAPKSVTVAVTKGTAYKAFEGTFTRHVQTTPPPIVLSPEAGSSLELLGRIGLTHYMQKADGMEACMINFAEVTFDNAYMTDFLLTYGNLFLSGEATSVPEISESSLVCSISKEALNELFLTASAGSFDVSAFDGSSKNIVAKDDLYYIPCNGAYAGGLTIETTDLELVSDALSIGGIVAKANGTRYDVAMTLTTSADAASGTAGVRINAANYKLAK